MSKWEVCLADVPFEEIAASKIRPVLILDDSAVLIDCLKLTSHGPRPGEYVLQDWQACGLKKQTTVRLSKRLALPNTRIIKKIGTLSILDIAEIQKRLIRR